MLLDRQQRALDRVIVECRDLADRYEDEAKLIEDRPLADMLRQTAAQRRAGADHLAENLHRLHQLSRYPDADLEFIENLKIRLKTLFSMDKKQEILDDLKAGERRLLEAIAEARGEDLGADSEDFLHSMEAQSRQTMRCLNR